MEPDPHIGFPLSPVDFHCPQWIYICFVSFSNPQNGKTFWNGVPFLGMDFHSWEWIPFLGLDFPNSHGFSFGLMGPFPLSFRISILSMDSHCGVGLPMLAMEFHLAVVDSIAPNGSQLVARGPSPLGEWSTLFAHALVLFVVTLCCNFSSNCALVQRPFWSEQCYCGSCWCSFSFFVVQFHC